MVIKAIKMYFINIFNIRNKKQFFLTYTIFFIVISCIIFSPFMTSDKSFIWRIDGLSQHYTTLLYLSDYFKQILSTGQIPMIDFNVGYGYDIITALNFYGLGDPLLLLAVLFSKNNLELLYNFLVVFHFYLAGISFAFFCFHMQKKYFQTLLGTFVYIFCGYCLFAGVRHPFFMNPVIYLPLLLLGVEKIITNRKSILFVIMVTISAVSNYYFFYMLTIICFIYALIRYFYISGADWRKNICLTFFSGIAHYLLGIGIASVLLIPAVIGFSENSRIGSEIFYENSKLFYSTDFYLKFLYSLFSPVIYPGYWEYLSYSVLALLAVINVLFFRKKKYWPKYIFFVFLLMLFIPWAGHFMNGFSYVCNRWVFAFSFIIAYIFVDSFDELFEISTNNRILISSFFILLFFWHILSVPKISSDYSLIGFSLVFIGILALWMIASNRNSDFKNVLLLFLVIINVLINANALYGNKHFNYVKDFHENQTAYATIMQNAESSVSSLKDSSFYRVSSDNPKLSTNQAMVNKENGLTSYFSTTNRNIYQYLLDMEIPLVWIPHKFHDLDQRVGLESLASVKYFAMQENSDTTIPTGYELFSKIKNPYSGKQNKVFKNVNALPLGYSYDKSISADDYSKLDAIEKEQVMLQAIILERGNTGYENLGIEKENILFGIEKSKDISWDRENNKLNIKKAKAALKLNFKPPRNNDIFVRISGFDVSNNPSDLVKVTVDCNNTQKIFQASTPEYSWHIDRKNYLLNFGTSDGTEQTCTITFPKKGTYTLEDIEVYSVPVYEYQRHIEKLGEEVLENIIIGTNTVDGTISVSEPKYLCFSIPYGKGWKAYVDGQETELLKANVMYMALPLEPGEHEIHLSYCTPGIKAGAVISVISLVVFLGIFIREKRIIQKT